jgi:iron complex outermembrane receptor protein
MTYLSYLEGFKSGGFTQRSVPAAARRADGRSGIRQGLRGGFKLQTTGHRLQLNGAAFYTDYTDIQVQGFTAATGVAPIYINGPSAYVQGAELELQAAPGGDASRGGCRLPRRQVRGTARGRDRPRHEQAVRAAVEVDAERVGAETDLARSGPRRALTPRLAWSYRSKFYNDASNIEAIAQPAYSLVDASLAWRSSGGRWTVTANVDNVTDEDYIVASSYNAVVRNYNVVPARAGSGRSVHRWSSDVARLNVGAALGRAARASLRTAGCPA